MLANATVQAVATAVDGVAAIDLLLVVAYGRLIQQRRNFIQFLASISEWR